MPSRQDQLHSYQYSVQRVVAALVSHDPDPHRSPLRRAGTTALVSLVIAAAAVGAVAIYGLLTGTRSKDINQDTVVYVEKGSGARFVYNSTEKLLHPVLNYSSALLISNGAQPHVVNASHQQLATVPLGAPLGIPGAPDSLPGAGDLLTGAWSVCTQSPAGTPQSTVVVGRALPDGAPAQDDGLLVIDSAHQVYLVYHNRRYLIPGSIEGLARILPVLGPNTTNPWPVDNAFANAVPLGADLKPPKIPGAGRRARDGRYEVGQVIYSALPQSATQWWVVLADAPAPVTEMQAKLLTTAPGAPAAVEDAGYGKGAKSRTTISDVGRAAALPATVPKLRDDLSSLCFTVPMLGSADRDPGHSGVRINASVPAGIAATGTTVPGGNPADRVSVPRGAGAVVVSASSPTAPAGSGTVTLVTDTGKGYAIAGPEALGKLGYAGVDLTTVRVPAELVGLLHQGPALDPVQAAKPGQ